MMWHCMSLCDWFSFGIYLLLGYVNMLIISVMRKNIFLILILRKLLFTVFVKFI